MMSKLFQWIVRHPLWTLGSVGVITAGLGWASLSLHFSADLREMLPDQDFAVQDFIKNAKNYGSQDFLLVAVHAQGTVFTPAALKKIWDLAQTLQQLPDYW